MPDLSAARRAGGERWAAVGVGLALFLAIALTIDDPGITWDEPPYLHSARVQLAWLGGLPEHVADGSLASWFSADTLETYWNFDPYHNPHPPFYKVLSGLTWAAFHPWLGDYAAFRLSSAGLLAVLAAVLCRWASSAAGGAPAGIAAGLALALMPRVFGDGHVAATDLPLTVFWSVAAFFFWRAVHERRTTDFVLFGVAWGMALATKFHGLFVAVPLVLWAALHARRELLRVMVVGATVALAVMVILNPWLWRDPVGHLADFVKQSTSRAQWVPIPTFYLGRQHGYVLPWHHALVLTAVTVPLPLLALAGIGTLRVRDQAVRRVVSFCLIQILFYQLLMALPSSPGHNGVRLFLPQFPFLALLAGVGFGWLWSVVGRRSVGAPRARRLAQAVLAALFFVPPVAGLVRAHPFELAYFNEVVGGARGAYARGFESTYWFDAATPPFLRRLERTLPAGARVWAHPAPWHYEGLQEAGLLRRDIVFTDSLPAPFLLLMSYQGTFGKFEWLLHERVPPVLVEAYEGVPLLALYRWQ